MKRERLEELVRGIEAALPEHLYEHEENAIRAALLAVERETVERCAKVADDLPTDPRGPSFNDDFNAGCRESAIAIRSLLTEETIGGALDEK